MSVNFFKPNHLLAQQIYKKSIANQRIFSITPLIFLCKIIFNLKNCLSMIGKVQKAHIFTLILGHFLPFYHVKHLQKSTNFSMGKDGFTRGAQNFSFEPKKNHKFTWGKMKNYGFSIKITRFYMGKGEKLLFLDKKTQYLVQNHNRRTQQNNFYAKTS